MDIFDISGKTTLITGASQGIGYALAHGFAQAGAQVIMNARNSDKLESALTSIRADNLEAAGLQFDVTNSGQVDQAG